MARVISLQVCGIILDELYHNSCKSSVDQVSMDVIRKRCKVSINTVLAFKNILIENKLLLVDGKGRSVKYEWNPQRSAMNPSMARHIYDIYLGTEKRKVKLRIKTKETKITLESALSYLVKHGYTGTITKQVNKYTTETIDLKNYSI